MCGCGRRTVRVCAPYVYYICSAPFARLVIWHSCFQQSPEAVFRRHSYSPPRVSPTNAHFLIGNMFSSPAHLPSKRGELRILMNLRSKSDSVRQLSSSCWPTFRHRTARLGGTFFLCWICYLRNRLDVSIKRYEKPTGAQLLRIVARLGASTYTPKWFGLAVLIRTSTSNFER